VKSQEAISRRLRNLRLRYAKQHVKESQARCHRNCTYNHEQPNLSPLKYSRNGVPEIEYERSPRKSVTLVVLQDQVPTRLCMYGSQNPSTWSGDICDNDDIAKSCKYFQAKVGEEEARRQFMEKLEDDEYVYDNFRDIAALQWVLDDRVASHPLTILERLSLWFSRIRNRPAPMEKDPPVPELPENLWDDNEV